MAYALIEGGGLTGSYTVDGYYVISKEKSDYSILVSLNGFTGLVNTADKLNWYGSAALVAYGRDIAVGKLEIDNSQNYLVGDGYTYIGETKMKLPKSGSVDMRLYVDYFFGVAEGRGNALTTPGGKNETIKIH